jgi:hypothetical protein
VQTQEGVCVAEPSMTNTADIAHEVFANSGDFSGANGEVSVDDNNCISRDPSTTEDPGT